MMLPRYFIGSGAEHLTMTANGNEDPNSVVIGEYHLWSPDATLGPTSVCFYRMARGDKTPHPHWRALPHLLDPTPVRTALAPPTGQAERRAALIAAWAQTVVPVLATDTTFLLVKKLHAQMKNFHA